MEPWVIDANNMGAEELAPFQNSLLHINPEIEAFLDPSNRTQMIIQAPKGFGKTLLLKAKRLAIQAGGQTVAVPSDTLVDKPSGTPGVGTVSEFIDIRTSDDYWKTCWMIALIVAVLKSDKATRADMEAAVRATPLLRMFEHATMSSPCDFFDQVVTMDRKEYFRSKDAFADKLVPAYRAFRIPVAVFIDNIDEYYETAVRDRNGDGDVHRSYWYFAQIGCALAARDLSHINAHVKIYVSIRKEVFQRALSSGALGVQLKGSATEIKYHHTDLVDIIHRNIEFEKPARLVRPHVDSPVEKFFGTSTGLVHPLTGDEENVLDYWLRHTLGRPRDIAVIGHDLSILSPKDRTEAKIRNTVRNASRAIATGYLAEMAPHLQGFDKDLILRLIPRNFLSPDEIKQISQLYADEYALAGHADADKAPQIFGSLHKLGLLGRVVIDAGTDQRTQRFLALGESALDDRQFLPKADTYLIHPVLDEVIGDVNPDYFANLNRFNIVGHGRLWRDSRETLFILKGDVKGFSEFMAHPVASKSLPKALRRIVEKHGAGLALALVTEGDAVVLIATSPYELIVAGSRIQKELAESEFKAKIRFGGESGLIEIDQSAGASITGLAIRTAARLEPFAPPGRILVSQTFLDESLVVLPHARLLFELASPGDFVDKAPPHRGGMFDIAKTGSTEPAMPTRLYFVSVQEEFAKPPKSARPARSAKPVAVSKRKRAGARVRK